MTVRSKSVSRAFAAAMGPAGFVAFVGGYLGLLAWFKFVDFYHEDFSAAGVSVAAYNFLRVLFIFYLFWMVYCAGALLLRVILPSQVKSANIADDLALKFFAGTGVWHVVLLLLGYLQLYTEAVAIGITLPVVALSFFEFRDVVHRAKAGWLRYPRAKSLPIGVANWLFPCLATTMLLLLLAAKGLYPGGGHDYFVHYFAYYRSVIDHAGLWPNNVWYHYYYSKGAGLYFLGILLTDPLAPQLVSFCFMAVAGLVVYRFIERFSRDSFWPWVGVVVFFGLYIYTPGRREFESNGGWGDFEKLHELNTALVIAILWMTASGTERGARWTAPWIIGAVSAITAAVILNPPISVYLCGVFCLLGAWFFVRDARSRSMTCFALAGVSGAVLCAILALNYFTSGLIDDQGILYFWPFANVEKLYQWGALARVVQLDLDRVQMASQSVSFSLQFVWLLLHFLRYYLLYPLVIGGLLLLIVAAARPSSGRRLVALGGDSNVPVLICALLVFLVIGCVSRTQYVSFFRFSSFIVPILIVSGAALWGVALEQIVSNGRPSTWPMVAPFLAVAAVVAATLQSFDRDYLRVHLLDTWRFAVGRFSIDQAYTTQNLPGRYPWGAIYGGARGAYRVAGPRTPIWSFHVSSYCLLPACNIMTYPAFTLGRDWDLVMFGTPQEAKQVLQNAGINYFLFSRELGVEDPLVASPLFAPDRIDRSLGILWTDGTTALLTWLQPGMMRFDGPWIESYREAAKGVPSVDELKEVFARLRATPHPWQSFKLPL